MSLTPEQQVILKMIEEDMATVAKFEKELNKLRTLVRVKENQIKALRAQVERNSITYDVPIPN